MALSAGERLGPYEILERIGAGGMGDVYRAHDSRLGRDVAIKISAEQFNERFEREARAVASLNHPNICHLYDVGANYLVMELVEGQTLKGSVPLEEALRIAGQIADALEAAHEKGIVHRDLKPGNVMITTQGTVKVLDFGLAKVTEAAHPETRATDSPTLTMAGVVMGTAAYMAPEQARGKVVDRRADIWAYGVVLYEMLTGRRLFEGETISDVLAAVLRHEPDLNRVPPQVRKLLRSCLQKDPKQRLQAIGDARLLLEGEPSAAATETSSRRGWVAAAILAVVAGITLWAPWRKAPAVPELTRLQLLPNTTLSTSVAHALSPDGRRLAFPAIGTDGVTRLWIRDLDSLEAHPLPGVQVRVDPPPPFWSPDSRSIAFNSENGLRRIDLAGGAAQLLWEGFAIGGSWNQEGTILFGAASLPGGIKRTSASGGVPSQVTISPPSRPMVQQTYPQFLPDGRHFLYLQTSDNPQETGILVGSLDDPPERQSSKVILTTDFRVVYVPGANVNRGHLLFLRDGRLMAYAFDAVRQEIQGEPIEVADQVGSYVTFGFFSASANGRLIYKAGGPDFRLTWLGRDGKILGTTGEAGRYSAIAIAPDGRRAVATKGDVKSRDLWLLDFARDTSTRFTFGPWASDFPVWSPNGASVVFVSNRDGQFNATFYQKPASGAGKEEPLLKSNGVWFPSSWSRDGRYLLYTSVDRKTRSDIWVLPDPGSADSKPFVLAGTEFNEDQGRFSPDARWVAYVSDESGRGEIYVREFSRSGSGGKWLVSKGGGNTPRWQGDSRELFYLAPDGTMMSVDVGAGTPFQAGAPKVLFKMAPGSIAGDVTADGKRFLIAAPAQQTAQEPFTVVLNWQALLSRTR